MSCVINAEWLQYCGLRSLVIRCYRRRHGSAEPELFMQPSWSSQASRLGRAANGAARGAGGCGEQPGAAGASSQPRHGVPTCMGLAGLWWVAAQPPQMAWEGLRGVRRAGAGRAPVMRKCGILRAPRERADVCVPTWEAVPALHIATQAHKSPFTSSC